MHTKKSTHRVEYWTSMKSCITRFMPSPPKKVKGVTSRHTCFVAWWVDGVGGLVMVRAGRGLSCVSTDGGSKN